MPQIGVYVLQGTRHYIGSTIDLDRRLVEHRSGHTHTTRRIGNWQLVGFFPCKSIAEARALEKKIKQSKNISRWLVEQPRNTSVCAGLVVGSSPT